MTTLFFLSFGLVSLIVASLLIAWFSSTLPVHVFALLHRLGFGRSNTEAWDQFDEFTMVDWMSWLVWHWSATWKQKFVGTLITCPICLSFHLSFWTSVGVSLVLYYGWISAPVVFLLIPICTFGCPIVSVTLYTIFNKLEK